MKKLTAQIVVDDLLTTKTQVGTSKKVILLIHGWGDSHETFKALQESLGDTFTTVSFDLPGFGVAQAPSEVWGLDEYAQFTKHFLEKNNLTPTAIIAHSNGGALALRGLATGNLATEKLIIIGGAGIRNKQKGRKAVLKLIAKTGKVATLWLPEHHKQKLRKKLYGVAGSDMLVAPHLQETFKKTVAQDVQSDAEKIMIPTLLIYGENDTATPPLFGEIFHQIIENSTLQIVGGAGHFVHQDRSPEVVASIKEFLDD